MLCAEENPDLDTSFCRGCNEYHNKRTTALHMQGYARPEKKTCLTSTDNSAEYFEALAPQAAVSSTAAAWLAAGLTIQAFHVCSFFMYLVVLNHLSDATMQLFLPFLVLYEPRLTDMSCYVLKGLLDIRDHQFQKFAVCPKCASLKTFDELQADSICRCSHFGIPCNTEMGKRTRSVSGQVVLQPLKTFAFEGVTKQLRRMVARKGFLQQLELWRKRGVASGTFADVYDGNVWREFQVYEGVPFLSAPRNLALQLNYGTFCELLSESVVSTLNASPCSRWL
jgi:hypothetical protein